MYNGEVCHKNVEYRILRILSFLLFLDTFRNQRIWLFLLFLDSFYIQKCIETGEMTKALKDNYIFQGIWSFPLFPDSKFLLIVSLKSV